MGEQTNNSDRAPILNAIPTNLRFLALGVLVAEAILLILATRASGTDLTLLIIGMLVLLFLLVLVGVWLIRSNKSESSAANAINRRGSNSDLAYLGTLISSDQIKAITLDARTHSADHMRIACAHTVWSCRPDLARAILEDAKNDLSPAVKLHANGLLVRFYGRTTASRGSDEDLDFLEGLFPPNLIQAIIRDARTHHTDHIRIACAHTLWSCRPDLARAVLEDAKTDLSPLVKNHANGLLDKFYR
jgi:hypothetical protein